MNSFHSFNSHGGNMDQNKRNKLFITSEISGVSYKFVLEGFVCSPSNNCEPFFNFPRDIIMTVSELEIIASYPLERTARNSSCINRIPATPAHLTVKAQRHEVQSTEYRMTPKESSRRLKGSFFNKPKLKDLTEYYGVTPTIPLRGMGSLINFINPLPLLFTITVIPCGKIWKFQRRCFLLRRDDTFKGGVISG